MMNLLKLNEVFSNWVENGIFKYLNALEVPWKEDVTSQNLNIIYHGSRSGNKPVGSLIENLLVDSELSESSKSQIASAIFSMNEKNWNSLWNTLNLEYNPIENYSMTEKETIEDTHAGTLVTNTEDSSTKSENGTSSSELTGKETNVRSGETNVTNSGEADTTNSETKETTLSSSENIVLNNINTNQLYGFNAIADPVNADKQVGDSTQDVSRSGTNKDTISSTGKTTDSSTGKTTDSSTDTIDTTNSNSGKTTLTGETTYTHSNTDKENKTINTDRSLTRSGNIGVTTSQQMIESERELWLWNFFEKVFEDIDNILVLKIY